MFDTLKRCLAPVGQDLTNFVITVSDKHPATVTSVLALNERSPVSSSMLAWIEDGSGKLVPIPSGVKPSKSSQGRDTFPFKVPRGFPLTPLEGSLLKYVVISCGKPCFEWPEEVFLITALAGMERKGYIRRKSDPLRFYPTKEGASLFTWLNRLVEHWRLQASGELV